VTGVSLPAIFADPTFYEPWWMQIAKAIVVFALGLQLVPLVLVAERKVLGRFQNRYGPNRVGPYGALQPLADIVKLATKEQFRPRTSIGWLFAVAPVISILTAVAALALIPFGTEVDMFGTTVGLYGVDVSIGPLYLFAFGAIAFYGIMLGGWASGSKYSFLGSMRAAAQLISYEVAQGLSIVGLIMMVGSLSMTDIVEWQETNFWMVGPQLVGFLIFLVAAFAETNRPPFDLPEADAELVGGYNTEYGGGRFAAFFAAEYLNMVVISGIMVTLFFGGWDIPIWDQPNWIEPIVVIVKMCVFVFFFIWIRATLPRLRYDQLMSFGWKVLLPLTTINVLVTAIIVAT
jgi:NADH-quinone oxidoreductase subunit H